MFIEKDTDEEPSHEPVGYVKTMYSAFFHAEVDDTSESGDDLWQQQAKDGISLQEPAHAADLTKDTDSIVGEKHCNTAIIDDADKAVENTQAVQARKVSYLYSLIQQAHQQVGGQIGQSLPQTCEIDLEVPMTSQGKAQVPGPCEVRRSRMEKRPRSPDPMDMIKVRKTN